MVLTLAKRGKEESMQRVEVGRCHVGSFCIRDRGSGGFFPERIFGSHMFADLFVYALVIDH